MCNTPVDSSGFKDYLDIGFKFATILIASFNVYFATRIFRIKNRIDDSEKERDRKLQLLKTLVLDHTLFNFYSIFDEIESHLLQLNSKSLSIDVKKDIEESLMELFIKLRKKFYYPLLAVDKQLHNDIEEYLDILLNHLIDTIFDSGINLSYSPKFEAVISERLMDTKIQVIHKLFNYRG